MAFAKIRRDIVFYPEGVLVELRHGGLHHFVTDLHSVYIHLVVAQRGYGDGVADLAELRLLQLACIHVEILAQHRTLRPTPFGTAADELLCLDVYRTQQQKANYDDKSFHFEVQRYTLFVSYGK